MRPDLRPDVARDLATDLVEALTSVDGKLVRSLRALLTRPGTLTAEFLRGARNRYVTPIQTFLLANVVFFVIQGWLEWNTLRTPLYVHMKGSVHSGWARGHVKEFALERGTTVDALAEAFDARIETYSKSLVILMVPLFAIGVRIACRSRAGLLASLVFALHFYAAYLLLNGIVVLPIAKLVSRVWGASLGSQTIDNGMGLALLSMLTVYEFLALRAAFGYSGRAAALRALALTVAFIASMLLYRFLLFLIVLHTLPAGG